MTTLDGGVIIKKGGGGTPTPPSGGEEKVGMTYLTKEALFSGMGYPIPDSMTQEGLRGVLLSAFSMFPISGLKKTTGVVQPFSWVIGEEIDESRFTYEKWDALSICWDNVISTDEGNIPAWKMITLDVDELKEIIAQMFPNQLTEEEFFNK